MLIWRSQRITSSSAHYVTPLQKYFSHPSFSYLLFFFATPLPCPLHVKLRLHIAGCSKKKNHLDQEAFWNATQKTGRISQVQFITLFCSRWAAALSYPLPASANCAHLNLLGPKPFCSTKRPCFDSSSSSSKFFNIQSDILSTAGDCSSDLKLSPILMRDFAILWNYGIWEKLDRRWRQLISYIFQKIARCK
jgi:hypothetical protein